MEEHRIAKETINAAVQSKQLKNHVAPQSLVGVSQYP